MRGRSSGGVVGGEKEISPYGRCPVTGVEFILPRDEGVFGGYVEDLDAISFGDRGRCFSLLGIFGG